MWLLRKFLQILILSIKEKIKNYIKKATIDQDEYINEIENEQIKEKIENEQQYSNNQNKVINDRKQQHSEEYLKQKQFYEKMLGEENNTNDKNAIQNWNKILQRQSTAKKQSSIKSTIEETQENLNRLNEDNCPMCESANFIDSKIRLKKKDNPCLQEPHEIKHAFVCCVHHSKDKLSVQEMDPKNYKFLPSCTMEKIPSAGKPLRMSESVGALFR